MSEGYAQVASGSGRARRAVVVGGGLAGIAAALSLAAAGHRTTLLEGRPRLGGLAFSFTRGGLSVDNGQHVYLRCCTAYRQLLTRIGGDGLMDLQERLEVPVVAPPRTSRPGDGSLPHVRDFTYGMLRRTALPVPLHLAGALSGYPHLAPAERAHAARAALALRDLDPADPALDGRSFGDWLRERRQSPNAVAALWDLVGVATLNATADRTSLALAAKVFGTGLLSDNAAADIGLARVPLGRVHHDLALAALERAGVEVRLRARVTAVRPGGEDGARFTVEGPDGPLPADTAVLAVPQDAAHTLLPPGALDDPGRLPKLRFSPIVNLHVLYDRQVVRRPFLAVLGSPVQWVFDRTAHSGLAANAPEGGRWYPPGAQYLALSQSAADEEVDLPVDELRRRYLPELRRVLPGSRSAEVLDFFVTRERTATFAPAPGSGRLRPGQATRMPGLLLAGAWTATGWPATMEGAVRSGLMAARQALLADGLPLGPELRGEEALPTAPRPQGPAADGPSGGRGPDTTLTSGVAR